MAALRRSLWRHEGAPGATPLSRDRKTGGWRLGADVGGTFTDLVLAAPGGHATTRKVLSTTANYAEAVVRGIAELLAEAAVGGGDIAEIIHGTTVATNAILERRGARTGLITTEGFRDLLEIGRLRLSRLYDMDHRRPPPLVRRRWRLEVGERLDHRGGVVRPLDPGSVETAVSTLLKEDLEAVAVCLIHAYANPAHEQAVGAAIRAKAPHLHVTLSSEVLPEIREFERTSTAVANAYVMPVMDRYLSRLEAETGALGIAAPLSVMQSNGGIMTAGRARRRPVQLIESGPAAGVIAAAALSRRAGLPNVISLDMGGTTAKASVIEGHAITRSNELEIGGPISQGSRLNKGGGYLLRTPAIDIAEVGAGGGSLVTVASSGALRVGPLSAGAAPGPACYGLGGTGATLTDANVVLGYLPQTRLPSGLALAPELALRAVAEQVAQPLGLSIEEAAYGTYLVGCAGIARAVRAVTVERGRDPREFSLVAFGGNGPLFAAEMARSLEIGTVVVPPAPGVFSAVGLLEAEMEHHLVRTFNRMLTETGEAELRAGFALLEDEAVAMLREEGRAAASILRSIDVKYLGQSFELIVAMPEAGTPGIEREIAERFESEHERTYGHRATGDPIQIVNLRITARVEGGKRPPVTISSGASKASRNRPAYFGRRQGFASTPVIGRGDLDRTPRPGPLLVEEYDATTLVPFGCTACIDALDNIVITVGD
ncbi:MAG TPA: hydantoinase/oxoprolinase family protein [Stellaceae bacterium]|nr:hydantoinase/oxoprolinase family protein [Stellaceae bacterium]